jgi:hypothetical protein
MSGQALIELIEPPQLKTSSKSGRPPYALATMLRIPLWQQWLSLSDPATGETLEEFTSAEHTQEQLQGERSGCAYQSVPGPSSVPGNDMISGVVCPLGQFQAQKEGRFQI